MDYAFAGFQTGEMSNENDNRDCMPEIEDEPAIYDEVGRRLNHMGPVPVSSFIFVFFFLERKDNFLSYVARLVLVLECLIIFHRLYIKNLLLCKELMAASRFDVVIVAAAARSED